ncbi:MAG: prefoldin subunit [Candidatus Aenigmarchaeota archaeon]|nr:prefoldin subunit [Candidatus Aenigmarchaeota archaeon]
MTDEKEKVQEQLQSLLIQKETLRLQLRTIENSLEELKKLKDEYAYKLAGNVLVKKKRDELIKELEELKKVLEIKIKSIKSTEEKLTKKE